MHEYAVVSALLEQVQEQARSQHGAVCRVCRVHVAVGELAGLDCGLFQTAYEAFRLRSVCAEAELQVREVPARWACPRCQAGVTAGALLRCADCGVPAVLVEGADLILERIEMEVSDV